MQTLYYLVPMLTHNVREVYPLDYDRNAIICAIVLIQSLTQCDKQLNFTINAKLRTADLILQKKICISTLIGAV